LEESEFTCAAAVKARKSMEVEIEDLHVQMEEISKAKQMVGTLLYIIFSSKIYFLEGSAATKQLVTF
ncbi:hypothetical protein XENORESO_019474, partial [Xenotaenia resolanae]